MSMIQVKMIPVTSSIIDFIGYSPEGILHVQFKGGKIYAYDNVPLGLYEQLKNAKSVGAFFMTNIKGKAEYPYKLLKEESRG